MSEHRMRQATLEAFLARLYTDPALQERFRADPAGEAARAGLDRQAAQSMLESDMLGLELAGRSFSHKRKAKRSAGSLAGNFLARLKYRWWGLWATRRRPAAVSRLLRILR